MTSALGIKRVNKGLEANFQYQVVRRETEVCTGSGELGAGRSEVSFIKGLEGNFQYQVVTRRRRFRQDLRNRERGEVR